MTNALYTIISGKVKIIEWGVENGTIIGARKDSKREGNDCVESGAARKYCRTD